ICRVGLVQSRRFQIAQFAASLSTQVEGLMSAGERLSHVFPQRCFQHGCICAGQISVMTSSFASRSMLEILLRFNADAAWSVMNVKPLSVGPKMSEPSHVPSAKYIPLSRGNTPPGRVTGTTWDLRQSIGPHSPRT